MRKKLKLITMIFVLCCCTKNLAQVGINTKNPLGVFHVDGLSNNIGSSLDNTMQSDDFIFTNENKVGIGTIEPNVKLDARNTIGDQAIAIGRTKQTAIEAGEGAIRYLSNNGGKLQYSDGLQWVELVSSPKKVYVRATRTNALSIVISTGGGNSTYFTGWNNEYADDYNSFNNSTGIFTAPRAGNYSFNVTLQTIKGNVGKGYIELGFFPFSIGYSTSKTTKCIKGISRPGEQVLGLSCNATLSLDKDEKIEIRLYNATGNVQTLSTKNFVNNISILEI